MPMNIRDLILIDQPTGAPTRKMQAVGISAIAGTVIAGLVPVVLPDLSDACGEELGAALYTAGGAALTGLLAYVSGYRTRNRATDAGT